MHAAYATSETEQEPGTATSVTAQESVTIVLMLNMSDPDNPVLTVPAKDRRLIVDFGSTLDITYQIPPELPETVTEVTFDTPAITFAQDGLNYSINPPAEVDPTSTPTSLKLTWTNATNRSSVNGTSFYYTLHAIVTDTANRRIPVSHDPTVHNDPPG